MCEITALPGLRALAVLSLASFKESPDRSPQPSHGSGSAETPADHLRGTMAEEPPVFLPCPLSLNLLQLRSQNQGSFHRVKGMAKDPRHLSTAGPREERNPRNKERTSQTYFRSSCIRVLTIHIGFIKEFVIKAGRQNQSNRVLTVRSIPSQPSASYRTFSKKEIRS